MRFLATVALLDLAVAFTPSRPFASLAIRSHGHGLKLPHSSSSSLSTLSEPASLPDATEPSASMSNVDTNDDTLQSTDLDSSNDSNEDGSDDDADKEEDDAASEPDAPKFDWFKAWYPLVPVEILDPEIPHTFKLLNIDVVVWNDGKIEGGLFGPKTKRKKSAKRVGGQWRAFVDECPHRKVPLSEGRVEDDGTLLCSYHAWRFDGQGTLVDAPQLDADEEQSLKALDLIKKNPKSQCNSFPVQIIDGVMWIWPETGDDARIESALTPAHNYKPPVGDNPNRLWEGPWNYRELPYSSDYFLENVVDPAHVPVSHHNVVGSRYDDHRMIMTPMGSLTKDGFGIRVARPSSNISSTTVFHPPSSVAIENPFQEGAIQALELYTSPSKPGFCNHVGRMVVVKPESGEMPKLLSQFTLPLPKWLNHVMASAFLNQDALFLHHQERHLSRTKSYSSVWNDDDDKQPDHYTKAVLPINADRGVVMFRNWLRIFAGGRIPYKHNPSMPVEANNEIVFDVWNAHTKHCRYCLDALKNLKKARMAAFFVATCLAVIRPTKSKALQLASVLVTGGIGFALNKLIGMFYRYEYSHGHND